MKILFIGGTGTISSACSRVALDRGMELYLLSRGKSQRPVPAGAQLLMADYHQPDQVERVLDGLQFDTVVDWIAYQPEDIRRDLDLYRQRTDQYIFISSASAYQTPPAVLPVKESTLLDNPYWEYSSNKIACEEVLLSAYHTEKYPITIVRPSHTYAESTLPLHGGWTMMERMRTGQPVIVHGDGTSLWTLTHHADFAAAFVGLFANSRAIGQAVHITSDEWLNWNQIYEILAQALGVTPRLVHVPSELINAYDPLWGASLLGDKASSMVFDNQLIKQLVPGWSAGIPFSRGAREMVHWYLADPDRQLVDVEFNHILDRILDGYAKAWPQAAEASR